MLDFAQLACFVAAAEEMHFGRAAIRLNMTQPTLSRQVQALERALKVQLFERANRSVRLATAGRGFLPEAKRILALSESASTWARRVARGEAGVIVAQPRHLSRHTSLFADKGRTTADAVVRPSSFPSPSRHCTPW